MTGTPGNARRNNGNKHGTIPAGILSLLNSVEKLELENVTLDIGDLEFWIPTGAYESPGVPSVLPAELKVRPAALLPESFSLPVQDFPGRIREVQLGATRAGGGSRARSYIIGGSDAPPFTFPDKPPLHPPVFAMDVFDMEVAFPRALKAGIKEVMHDPAEWARMNVSTYGADMVTIHLMSTDPLIRNTSPAVAARTVEEILQAVDVPLIVGGCGDPHKDAEVFAEVAAVAAGERLLLNSVTLDMAEAKTLEMVAAAAKKYNHAVLGFTGLELNKAKELNRRLYDYLPPESIVMDLTTVALGYGLEYSFTIHERARYAALMGDTELQHPTISASTNAWAAREAWMQMDAKYGSKHMRGPIWETLNALILMLTGVDVLMMMHPAAIRTVRDVTTDLMNHRTAVKPAPVPWADMRI